MSNRKIVGQIGLGYWGKNILRNLYELGVLKVACDSNQETLKKRKNEFSDVQYTLHCADILQSPKVEAVIISTPPSTHYELVKEALRLDKDVFVEKPLALNVADGAQLVQLAEEKNKFLMVGHILQYHPAIRRLKQIIMAGELGKMQYIYSNRLNIGKLRVEENILWSFAPHDISVILMLLEEEPQSVRAFGGDYLNRRIHDTTLMMMEFSNGAKCHIFVSWLHPYKEQKLIVVGTKAMAVFDDLSKEKLYIYPHTIKWKEGKIPVAHKAERYIEKIEEKEPLKEELKHFIDCVTNRIIPLTDGNEALRVLRVLERAEKFLKGDTQ